MYYLEHCLRQAGVVSPAVVGLVHTGGEDWVAPDLRAELRDVFPQAAIVECAAGDAAPPRADLYVVPVTGTHDFPFHDVVYRQLDAVADTLAALPRAAPVLLCRVHWREAEVVRLRHLWRWRARRRLEALAIGLLERETPLRRLLRPLA
jgi:hypothetical protein